MIFSRKGAKAQRRKGAKAQSSPGKTFAILASWRESLLKFDSLVKMLTTQGLLENESRK